MALLVLDASVVVKWFKEEIHKEHALKIREDFYLAVHEITVPDLLLYELANSMRFDGKFDEKSVKSAIESIIEMDIDITIPTGEIINSAIELSYKHGVTVYDAIYVALANLIDATFVTADGKLYDKIKELSFVKFIADMKTNES